MNDLIEIVELIKSLGGGGLLGAGLLGLIYLLYPGLFPATVTIEIVLVIGSLLGAGCHRLFNSLAVAIAESRKERKEIEEYRKKNKLLTDKLKILNSCETYGFLPASKVQKLREALITNYLLDRAELDDIKISRLPPIDEKQNENDSEDESKD